jgi:hypothetical protein
MLAWAGRRAWLAVRTVIRVVAIAHHEQVRMWECVLETSGAAPLTAAGPLRWIRSLDGYRLAGSHLPVRDPAKRGGNPGPRSRAKIPASAPPAAGAHPGLARLTRCDERCSCGAETLPLPDTLLKAPLAS